MRRTSPALWLAFLVAAACAAVALFHRREGAPSIEDGRGPFVAPPGELILVSGEEAGRISEPEPPAPASERLAEAALERVGHRVVYDARYVEIDYPGGDVPDDRGVCTDVVVRSYRRIGIDLQVEVHEDMKRDFDAYPREWDLAGPDPNIDHRRVPNLMTFFRRRGASLGVSGDADEYLPGDVVAWQLPRGLKHIGIVSSLRSDDGRRRLVVHNIGPGPKAEDVLFKWRMIGHYRWSGPQPGTGLGSPTR